MPWVYKKTLSSFDQIHHFFPRRPCSSSPSPPDAPAPPCRRRATDAVRLLDVAVAAATDTIRLLNVAADALCPDDGVDPRAPAGPDTPPTVPRRPL